MREHGFAWIALGIALGLAVGIGSYTFIYAKGYSYLSNNPATCANCHVMQGHYDAWVRSSHKAVATCNDCHAPEALVTKYYTKAANGFWHSLKFTTGRFADPLRIRAVNHRVTESACRRCHQAMVHDIDARHGAAAGFSCLRCHASVGHFADLGSIAENRIF
jgi:cytochrome c nitrite reductase small subunit